MDSDKLKRVMSAVEEFAADEMEVEQHEPHQFEVKGYTVNTEYGRCECKDHEYNERYCKHLVAATLYDLWEHDDNGPEPTESATTAAIGVNHTEMPSTLTTFRSWLLWEYRGYEDERAPIPLNPETGEPASGLDDCVTYERAINLNSADTPPTDGVMFLVSDADPFTVETYENIRDATTGDVSSTLKPVLENPLCYADVHPNGTDVTVLRMGGGRALTAQPVPLTGYEVTGADIVDASEVTV